MRRRDESQPTDDPFAPRGRRQSINWDAVSHAFMPQTLRTRAISVSVTTPESTYERGRSIPITITFENRLPLPVRLRTDTPLPWVWAINGHDEASTLSPSLPDRPSTISFTRGERKQFHRQWPQRLQVSTHEWQPVDPGTYTISARICRRDAADTGLTDETPIEILE